MTVYSKRQKKSISVSEINNIQRKHDSNKREEGEREKILHCMLTGIIYLKIPSKQKTIIEIKLNTKNNQSLEGKKE